ncbi:MAG: GAF domain-containing protein [Caldimonas sp.]
MTDSEFSDALQALGSRLAAADIDRVAYCDALVRLLHGRFRASRVSIWRLETARTADERVLHCEAAFDPSASSASRSAPDRGILTHAEFAPYLAHLIRNGIYVSNDALADAVLEPMRAGYLIPGRVEALMDAAIDINGAVVGVVCCEEVDRKREWSQPEITAMRRAIATVNVHLARLRDEEARARDRLD